MLLMQCMLAMIVGFCLLICIDQIVGGLITLFLLGLFLAMLLLVLRASNVHESRVLTDKQVCVERLSSALNTTLSEFAAERRRLQHGPRSAPAAVDRYLLPARHAAGNSSAAVAAVSQRDIQTDRRTDGRTLTVT